jgi:hypothetical protein
VAAAAGDCQAGTAFAFDSVIGLRRANVTTRCLHCLALFWLSWPRHSRRRSGLEAENAALRHCGGRCRAGFGSRTMIVGSLSKLYGWFPSFLQVLAIIRPATLVRWHRAGFRCYWRWKSRSRGGRPQIDAELRALIRRMSIENPLWGAPRIHGELLKLGLMSRSRAWPSTWCRRCAPAAGHGHS